MSIEVNQRLLDIFGLRGQHVRSLTLHAAVGQPTTLATTRVLHEPGDVREVKRVFSLLLAEPEDPVERALLRVQEVIDSEAARAKAQLHDDHVASVRRICGRPPVFEDYGSNGSR